MYYLIDAKLKIIFGWSFKCGCSHVKRIYWFLFNNTGNKLKHVEEEKNKLPDNIEEYTTILIIRNPYERLVSGFLDKYKMGGYFRPMWKKNSSLTFLNFVEELLINNWDVIKNDHFILQTDEEFNKEKIKLFKSKELKIYDLKNIDYNFIENLYQKKIPEQYINYKGNNIRKAVIPFENHVYNLELDKYIDYKIAYEYFYNEEIKNKVYNYYKNDFDFFKENKFNYDIELKSGTNNKLPEINTIELNNIESKFIFIPCLDQGGNDMYRYRKSVPELLIIANNDKSCCSFNTLGFFKNKIELLKPSSYFKQTDGIYIKKEYLNTLNKLNIKWI